MSANVINAPEVHDVTRLEAGEVEGGKSILGWQRILSEGHVWLERMNDMAGRKVDYVPSARKAKAAFLMTGSIFAFLIAAAIIAYASASPVMDAVARNGDSPFGERYSVSWDAENVSRMNMQTSNASTMATGDLLLSKDQGGRIILKAVVEDYLAGSFNKDDFIELETFADGWPSGKVAVIKTDRATWFGFRFKAQDGSIRDNSLILVAPKGSKDVHMAYSDIRSLSVAELPRIDLRTIPREAVKVGLAKKDE